MSVQPIYLASPYTHESELIQELRFRAAQENVARLLNSGIEACVFSPIVHCHWITELHEMPKQFPFWKAYGLAMIDAMPRFGVLHLPGWDESVGVKAEAKHAINSSKFVEDFWPQGEFFEVLQRLA